MWQVHAGVLAVSVIVVAVITTIISGQGGRTRTWIIYKDRTKILPILCFNLILLVSEGVTILGGYQVISPIADARSLESATLVNLILFSFALLLTYRLFVQTLRFLDPGYVEDLSEDLTNAAIPDAVRRDIRRRQEFNQTWAQEHLDDT